MAEQLFAGVRSVCMFHIVMSVCCAFAGVCVRKDLQNKAARHDS